MVQVTGAASTVLGGQRYVSNSSDVVFHSDADLLGNGNHVSQIFVFDLEARVVDGLVGLTQLTDANDPSQEPSLAKRGDLAFESQADFLGTGRPGWQIFIVRPERPNIGRGPIVQLTDGPGEARAPLINDQAKYIFFETTLDLLALGLAPGSYLYRSEMGRVGGTIGNGACPSYPCTSNPGLDLVAPVPATNPTTDELGERVVFESTGDVLGGGATGVRQLYLHDFTTGMTTQLTAGSADSRNADMAADGTALVFESDADLAGSGSTRTQIFHLDLMVAPPVLTQLSFGTDGDSTHASIADSKDRVSFASTADLSGAGQSGVRQSFFLDLGVRLSRLTAGVVDQGLPRGALSFVALPSTSDLAGTGSTDLHLYIVNTFALLGPPPATPTPTMEPTPSGTVTPTPATPLPSPTATLTAAPPATPVATATAATTTPTSAATATVAPTPTLAVTATSTATFVATATATPTPTPTFVATATMTPTPTLAPTATPTPVVTASATPTSIPTSTPSPTPTIVSTPLASSPTPTPIADLRALGTCQKVLQKAARKHSSGTWRLLSNCASRVFKCMQTKSGASRTKCVEAARTRCVSAVARWDSRASTAFMRSVGRRCGPSRLSPADLLAGEALAFADHVAVCETEHDVALGGIEGVAACLMDSISCSTRAALAAAFPRADDFLALAGVAPTACGDTPHGDSTGIGARGRGSAVARCQAALVKSAGNILGAGLAAAERCAIALIQCRSENNPAATCAMSLSPRCGSLLLPPIVFEPGARERKRLVRACGTLTPVDLLQSPGLGFELDAERCAEVGVAAIVDLDDATTCALRSAHCAAAQILERAAPQAARHRALLPFVPFPCPGATPEL